MMGQKRQQKRLEGQIYEPELRLALPAVWAFRKVGFRAAMRRWRCGSGIGITARREKVYE